MEWGTIAFVKMVNRRVGPLFMNPTKPFKLAATRSAASQFHPNPLFLKLRPGHGRVSLLTPEEGGEYLSETIADLRKVLREAEYAVFPGERAIIKTDDALAGLLDATRLEKVHYTDTEL